MELPLEDADGYSVWSAEFPKRNYLVALTQPQGLAAQKHSVWGSRIDVQADLTVPGLTGVYALGDFANIAGKDGKPLPQLASVAEQSGKCCAKNILSDIAGKPRDSFQYFDKGIMAMIGRNSGVAEVGEHRHELKGAIAFAAWLGVHAALLTSTRAKMEAFMEWAWDYFGKYHGDAILDRSEKLQINWNDDGEEAASVASAASTK